MSLYRPLDCAPVLETITLQNLPIYLEGRIQTNNTIVTGFRVKFWDSDNNLIFDTQMTSSNSTYIDTLVKDGDYNSGRNGIYFKIPFIVNGYSFTIPDFRSQLIYNTSRKKLYYYSFDDNRQHEIVSFKDNSTYKWQITFYQADLATASFDSSSDVRFRYNVFNTVFEPLSEQDKNKEYNGLYYKWIGITVTPPLSTFGWADGTFVPLESEDLLMVKNSSATNYRRYVVKKNKNGLNISRDLKHNDMVIAEDTLRGTTSERLQGKPSKLIRDDYYVQPVYIDNLVENDNGTWDIDGSDDSNIFDIGTRIKIKEYDQTLGYIYPSTVDGALDPSLFQGDNPVNGFKIFKYGNNPDDMPETRKVDWCIEQTVPWTWKDNLSNPGNSYGYEEYWVKKEDYVENTYYPLSVKEEKLESNLNEIIYFSRSSFTYDNTKNWIIRFNKEAFKTIYNKYNNIPYDIESDDFKSYIDLIENSGAVTKIQIGIKFVFLRTDALGWDIFEGQLIVRTIGQTTNEYIICTQRCSRIVNSDNKTIYYYSNTIDWNSNYDILKNNYYGFSIQGIFENQDQINIDKVRVENTTIISDKWFEQATDAIAIIKSNNTFYYGGYLIYNTEAALPSIDSNSRILITKQPNSKTYEIDSSGYVVTNDSSYEGSPYNGVFYPEYSIKFYEGNLSAGTVTEVKKIDQANYLKVMVEWHRAQDADSVGELNKKVVYVKNLYNSDFSINHLNRGNVEIIFNEDTDQNNLVLNSTKIIANSETPLEIYPDLNNKTIGLLYYNRIKGQNTYKLMISPNSQIQPYMLLTSENFIGVINNIEKDIWRATVKSANVSFVPQTNQTKYQILSSFCDSDQFNFNISKIPNFSLVCNKIPESQGIKCSLNISPTISWQRIQWILKDISGNTVKASEILYDTYDYTFSNLILGEKYVATCTIDFQGFIYSKSSGEITIDEIEYQSGNMFDIFVNANCGCLNDFNQAYSDLAVHFQLKYQLENPVYYTILKKDYFKDNEAKSVQLPPLCMNNYYVPGLSENDVAIDYNVVNGHTYKYTITYYSLYDNTQIYKQEEVVAVNWSGCSISELVPIDKKTFTSSASRTWLLKYNIETDAETQNFIKTNFENLTKYSKFSHGQKNFVSGSVNALMGREIYPAIYTSKQMNPSAVGNSIQWNEVSTSYLNNLGGYQEKIPFARLNRGSNSRNNMLNAWREFCASKNPKLLRTEDGQAFIVQVTNLTTQVQNNISGRPTNVSFHWDQIGNVNDITVAVCKGISNGMVLDYNLIQDSSHGFLSTKNLVINTQYSLENLDSSSAPLPAQERAKFVKYITNVSQIDQVDNEEIELHPDLQYYIITEQYSESELKLLLNSSIWFDLNFILINQNSSDITIYPIYDIDEDRTIPLESGKKLCLNYIKLNDEWHYTYSIFK